MAISSHEQVIHSILHIGYYRLADPVGGIGMFDLHRHFTRQERKRIERDRLWLSRNRNEVIRLLRARDGDICLWCNKPNEDCELIAATDQYQRYRPV